jgi:hypothetical protein
MLLKHCGEPVQAFIQARPRHSRGGLHEPLVLEIAQLKALDELRSGKCTRHVLLVRKDAQLRVAKLRLRHHFRNFITGELHALAVAGVHHEDHTIGVFVVVAPQRAEAILAADVPDGHLQVLVLEAFHVEADGGDGADHVVQLELEEDGGLAGGVEADHDDAGIDLVKDVGDACEVLTHRGQKGAPFPMVFVFFVVDANAANAIQVVRVQEIDLSVHHGLSQSSIAQIRRVNASTKKDNTKSMPRTGKSWKTATDTVLHVVFRLFKTSTILIHVACETVHTQRQESHVTAPKEIKKATPSHKENKKKYPLRRILM